MSLKQVYYMAAIVASIVTAAVGIANLIGMLS
jgi:hypothetical protein